MRCSRFCGWPQRGSAALAEVYSPSVAVRLQHLCDAVIALEAVAEDSGVVKLAPDPARSVVLVLLCSASSCNYAALALRNI